MTRKFSKRIRFTTPDTPETSNTTRASTGAENVTLPTDFTSSGISALIFTSPRLAIGAAGNSPVPGVPAPDGGNTPVPKSGRISDNSKGRVLKVTGAIPATSICTSSRLSNA